jgi:hypothetical protein
MRTIRPYTVNFRNYGLITVPAGTILTHETSMGPDPKYHFVNSFGWIDRDYPEIAAGLKKDAESYGIDVPIEYTDQLTPEYALRKLIEVIEWSSVYKDSNNARIIGPITNALKIAKMALIP